MSVSGVLRIGEAALRVLDLEESVIHYRDRIGLQEMARDDDGRVYFKCWDEWDHHSIVIREGDEPAVFRWRRLGQRHLAVALRAARGDAAPEQPHGGHDGQAGQLHAARGTAGVGSRPLR